MSNEMLKLYPSSKQDKMLTVYIGEGTNAFPNGEVHVTPTGVTCNLRLGTGVECLERLIELCSKTQSARAPMMELFGKVRQLYPEVATGGLVFNNTMPSCYYDEDQQLVSMQYVKPLCVLLHELGHAYAHTYYPSLVGDEALAWDTAKSLALEVGYNWTEDDDQTMVRCLASYGIDISAPTL